MLLKLRWLALCLSPVPVVFEGCTECSDCHQGPIPVAYVRVLTATATGSLPGVAVQLERPGFVPLSAATDDLGQHTFEVLEAVDGESATLNVAPPPEYATPAPQVLSLTLNDTLAVEVMLQAAP
jgi:hypothetical protein